MRAPACACSLRQRQLLLIASTSMHQVVGHHALVFHAAVVNQQEVGRFSLLPWSFLHFSPLY